MNTTRCAASSPAAAAAAADVDVLLGLPYPPVQPLIGCENRSFAQDTITTRLPAIMDTVLADLEIQVQMMGGGLTMGRGGGKITIPKEIP